MALEVPALVDELAVAFNSGTPFGGHLPFGLLAATFGPAEDKRD
jgi:hypothetical protein